jgi:hypothetical protein
MFRVGAREGLKNKDEILKIIRSYINGVGFRKISRIFEIPLFTIFYFIKRIGIRLDRIKKEQNKDKITEKEIIEILEADELFTYIRKKNNGIRIWTAVNRNTLKLIDFAVGSAEVATWIKLILRLKE